MTFIVPPAFFYRVLRIASVLFLLVSVLSPPTTVALPRNGEITRIMKERAAVEKNLSNLKLQLQEYQSKLKLTTKKESHSFKALENIRNQILVLEKMINENQSYLTRLDGDIDRLNDELQGNRKIYGRVSDDFRRTVISAYKYGGNRDIEHFFAAGSVSKALVRAQYMGFFTRSVRSNVEELQQVAAKLENSRIALEQSYQQKAKVVREQEQQLKSWSASKKEKEVVLDRLKKNKQEYLTQLATVQKKRMQLQSRIESLILAEQRALEAERERRRKNLEARRRKALQLEQRRLEAQRLEQKRLEQKQVEQEHLRTERPAIGRVRVKKKKTVEQRVAPDTANKAMEEAPQRAMKSPEKEQGNQTLNLDSPELEGVSANFDKAFGSLPWPVQNGVVAKRFGTVKDKDLRIVTTNNGIDISVPSNTQVRAVSGGKVVQIAFLPTFGNIVIVRHPQSYLTVYANLGQLSVARDDIIKSQQLLGFSGKTAEGASVVHFEIWKGRVKQNPSKWLR